MERKKEPDNDDDTMPSGEMRFRVGDRSVRVRSRDAQWLLPLIAIIGLSGWLIWRNFELEEQQRLQFYNELAGEHKRQLEIMGNLNVQIKASLEHQQALLYMLAQTIPADTRPIVPLPDLIRRWSMPQSHPQRSDDNTGK